jgi:hypothetical protein
MDENFTEISGKFLGEAHNKHSKKLDFFPS